MSKNVYSLSINVAVRRDSGSSNIENLIWTFTGYGAGTQCLREFNKILKNSNFYGKRVTRIALYHNDKLIESRLPLWNKILADLD